MAKNLMSELIKLLGVELGEHFKICSKGCAKIDFPLFTNEYFFDEKGGLMCSNEGSFCKVNDASMLGKIILGDFEIVKLPWKPKYGEYYYFPSVQSRKVIQSMWLCDTRDCALKLLGMIYRTEEEANEHLAEDYERLTGRKLKNDA